MTVNNQSFFAHGKLLLTAEYLVLQGAKSSCLAIKTWAVHGASLPGTKKGILSWKRISHHKDFWFICETRHSRI